jgi:sugar (pentulose or hexulose) kinase
MTRLYIGIDIGSSSVRSAAFDANGNVIVECREEIKTRMQRGRAEQNPDDWMQSAIHTLRELATRLHQKKHHVHAIGVTGHCPTFALYREGAAVSTGIMYQDTDAAAALEDLNAAIGPHAYIQSRTGQWPSAYYVLPKLIRMRKEGLIDSDAHDAHLTVLQPRDAVLLALTGELATDPTHAACTLAYDLLQRQWRDDWMDGFGLHSIRYPKVINSTQVVGCLRRSVSEDTGLPTHIPVVAGAADSLAAVYGSGASEPGVLCDVSGTSTCLHATVPRIGHIEGINTYPHLDNLQWSAELGINATGASMKWLSEVTKCSYEKLAFEARKVEAGSNGLHFFPYMAGDRLESGRTGGFAGLKLEHGTGHLARAIMEGVAMSMRHCSDKLRQAGGEFTAMHTCGGGSVIGVWNQIKADVTGLPVSASRPADPTAFGAALAASRGVGGEMKLPLQNAANFEPDQNRLLYDELYKQHRWLEGSCLATKEQIDE